MKLRLLTFITALLALCAALPSAAQKNIVDATEKIRRSDSAGQSIENVVRRDPRTHEVYKRVLVVSDLTPQFARSLAHAIRLDEKNASENSKNISRGKCVQVLKFYDGKSTVSVAFRYNVKDYKNASVVVREDFHPRAAGRKMSHRRDDSDCSGHSLSRLPASIDDSMGYTMIIDSEGRIIFRQ